MHHVWFGIEPVTGSNSQHGNELGVLQLGLPDVGKDLVLSAPQHGGRNPSPAPLISDATLDDYLRRLAARGVAPKGFQAYRYQLQTVLRLAQGHAGRPVSIMELFASEALLGRVLVDDSGVVGRQLSRWSLAQRRSAVRSLATLMRPELMMSIGADPHDRLDNALRRVAERVGTGYRLSGGTPRRRGGVTPSSTQVAAILAVVSAEEGFAGLRNAAFFSILASTGDRVNALRGLCGSDCIELPSGRMRIFVSEKGKLERREVELSLEESAVLRAYADSFNACAAVYRWTGRIGLGLSGPVWRGMGGRCWTYHEITATLRRACEQANVPQMTPHAFRRAFASTAASVLPRHIVAMAGGWQGLERLDNHYIHVSPDDLWSRLAAANKLPGFGDNRSIPTEEPMHATT